MKDTQMGLRTKEKPLRQLEVRLAENQLEIERALSLRYDVFNQEMGEGLSASAATKKDRDEYDLYCDHLIVVDHARNDMVTGTYRLLRKQKAIDSIGFYSDTEFDLKNIYRMKAEIAEVGRSCVHPDYRDGSVISLLWSGIGEYIKQHNVRFLIGCGSIHSQNGDEISEIYAYLKGEGKIVSDDLRVSPLKSHVHPFFREMEKPEDPKAAYKKLPPLVKGYLRLGASIGGHPARDLEFGTTDLFIFFDAEKISEKYGKRYIEGS